MQLSLNRPHLLINAIMGRCLAGQSQLITEALYFSSYGAMRAECPSASRKNRRTSTRGEDSCQLGRVEAQLVLHLGGQPQPPSSGANCPAESLANSRDVSSQDEALLPAIRRLAELRDSKVTCAMTTGDFIRRGIAPLQRRPQPLWEVRQEMGTRVSSKLQIGRAHV